MSRSEKSRAGGRGHGKGTGGPDERKQTARQPSGGGADIRKRVGASAKDGSSGHSPKPGNVVRARNAFYLDGIPTVKKILAVSIACVLTSLLIAFYGVTHQQRNVYFATNQGGGIVKLIALNQPNHKDSVIAQWVTRALIETFDFNFGNYKYRLNAAKLKYYTKAGAQALTTQMQTSDTLSTVKNQQLTVSVAVTQVPIVVHEGIYSNGRYAWLLQAPAIITFRNTKNKTYTENVVFTVTVTRRSMLEDPTGLGIAQIIKTDTNAAGQ